MMKNLPLKKSVPALLTALFTLLTVNAGMAAPVDYRLAGSTAASPTAPVHKAPATQQVAEGITYIGYSEAEVDRSKCIGFDDMGDHGTSLQAIRLTTDMLAPYVGQKLSGIRAGLGEEVEDVTFFVRYTLTGENVIEKTVERCGMSWNNVKFDTPLTITAGQELFIGYSYYHEGERYVIGADNTHGFEQGSCYLGYISELENYFDDNSAEMFNLGKLLISGIIGDDISACGNSLTLLGSDLGTYVQRDSPTDVILEVFNSGWNEVTSVVVTATVDGQETTKTFGLFRPIPAYTSSTLLWEGLTLTDDANVTFEIGNVSNLTNYATRRTLSQDCSVYEGEGFKRKLLLEQFTGQSCSNCPAGVDAIDAFIVGHEEDIVWVAIHSFYLSPGLEDNFYNEAAQFYAAKFDEDGSAPMMTLNRARRTLYFTTEEGPASITAVTTHPMYFAYANNYQNFLDEEIAAPARVSVVIDQQYDAAADRLTVTVSGRATEQLPGTHVGLTVYVLEDGQISYQSGANSDYRHDNILRDVLTAFEGDVIEFDEDGYYEMTYTYDIPEQYVSAVSNVTTIPDRRQMKIAAFVSRFEDDKNDCMVYNADEQQLVSDAWQSGISDETMDGGVTFTFSDGSFHATASGAMSVEVYDLMGVRLPNKGLDSGVYLLRATDAGGHTYVTKMAVTE